MRAHRPIRRAVPTLFLGALLMAGTARGQDSYWRAFNPNLTAGSGVRATPPYVPGTNPYPGFNNFQNGYPASYGAGYGNGFNNGFYGNGFNNGFYGNGFNNGFYGNGSYGGNVAAVPFAVPGYAGNAYVGLPSYGVTYGQNVTSFGVANYGGFSQQYGAFGFPAYRSFGRTYNGVFGGFRR